jgi:N-acetylglucosaminyldiphosphoundecaprenol N-acetyl-beta-D-mannosaminyltransferase
VGSAGSVAAESHELPTIRVGGFDTAVISREGLAEAMMNDCLRARESGASWLPKLVFSSNGQGIALAGRDRRFAATMEHADIIHADGMPVVMASRMTRSPLPERICTTDFFHDAARAAVERGLRFFMLGGSDQLNREVVEAIHRQYPTLEVVGRHHGYFGEHEDERVCDLIQSARTDVLWVALGKPRQEEWSLRNRERLRGVGWIKTCGGLYSYLTGDAPRAPRWMRNVGLEWAYRAANEPGRLTWRYVTTNPYAFVRLLVRTERTA